MQVSLGNSRERHASPLSLCFCFSTSCSKNSSTASPTSMTPSGAGCLLLSQGTHGQSLVSPSLDSTAHDGGSLESDPAKMRVPEEPGAAWPGTGTVHPFLPKAVSATSQVSMCANQSLAHAPPPEVEHSASQLPCPTMADTRPLSYSSLCWSVTSLSLMLFPMDNLTSCVALAVTVAGPAGGWASLAAASPRA